MEKFTQLQSIVIPLDRGNIDTDQIIPKQFLRSIRKTGFGQFLFDEWRYLDQGDLGMDCQNRPKNNDFILNDPRYRDAKILLTQDNFGCGSSREHAVWSLMEYGFRVILAPSFGDIFANNSAKNGMLLITLPKSTINDLFTRVNAGNNRLSIDLAAQTITDITDTPNSTNATSAAPLTFDISQDIKNRLSNGLDDIGLTLQHSHAIQAYEQKRRQTEPWIFADFSL